MRFASAACLVILLASTSAAGGQPPTGDASPDANEDRRASLYKEGVILADQGKWAEAAERFRAAIAIRSAPKALVALAVAEENLGHLIAAERLYGQAASEARAAGLGDDEATALTALRLLTPRVPRVALVLPRDVPVTRLLVDGAPAAAQDGQLALDPGVRRIEIDAPGYQHYSTTLTLEESARQRLVVKLARVGEQKPTPSPSPDRAGRSTPIGALVLIGLGAAMAGTGMVLWGVGKSREADVSARCPDQRCPESARAELQPDIDGSHDSIVAGNFLVAGGAVVAVAGGSWWVVSAIAAPSAPTTTPASMRSPSAPRATAGLTVGGRF